MRIFSQFVTEYPGEYLQLVQVLRVFFQLLPEERHLRVIDGRLSLRLRMLFCNLLIFRRDEETLESEREPEKNHSRATKHEGKRASSSRKTLSTRRTEPHRVGYRTTASRTHCYIQTHLFSPTVRPLMINYLTSKIQLCTDERRERIT
jgi:hypothetical protein